MKRFAALLLVFVLVFCTVPMAGLAGEELEITLKINSEYQEFDMILVTLARANYQVLAPARPFAEAMDAKVGWDDATRTVSFTKGEYSASVTIGAENGISNGKETVLETPAQLVGETAYVPVEFVGDSLNYRVLREQYGRFIRLVQKTTTTSKKYDGSIKPGMAELRSEVHRPVPTEFEKSNELDDLLYYTDYEYVPEEELLEEKVLDTSNLPTGEVVYTNDDFVDSSGSGENGIGWWKPVEVNDEGVYFDKAVQIGCINPPSNQTFFIVKPTKRIEEYVDPKDKYLVKFSMRLVGGGHVDTGAGKAYIHVEESYIPTWIKSVSEYVEFDNEWKTFYALATGVENANHIGVSIGFWRQTVEIGGFEVQKLDRNADTSMFDSGFDEVTIDDTNYITSLNMSKYIGYNIDFYCRITDDSIKIEIIAFFPIQDEAERFELNFDDITKLTVTADLDVEAEYYSPSTKKAKTEKANSPIIMYNGKAEKFETAEELQKFLDAHTNQGKLVFLKNDRKDINDILFVENYDAYVISNINPEFDWISYNIYTSDGIERGLLDLSTNDNAERRVFYYDADGNEIMMGDLGISDVIMVYASLDKTIYNIYQSRKYIWNTCISY